VRETVRSFCRICDNNCAISVTVDDGRATRVSGDADNPVYRGYTCVKGRAQADMLTSPDRLLHSLARDDDGQLVELPAARALDEIAGRLARIVAEHGPRSVAGYAGTMALGAFPTAMPMFTALMDAIGTPMRYDPERTGQGRQADRAGVPGHLGRPVAGV
jgi:anaerobic selenocysteine-containing dehydrogenase